MSLVAHLQHFGLSDKEARVYLSALELGPSPVQVIARRAGVNRATTYVQIAALAGRGLMSSYDQGKKRFFVAEPPDRLLVIYDDELQHLRDKERILKEILPELKAKRPKTGVPAVRLFEGHEGLEAVRQELLQSGAKEFSDLLGRDYYLAAVPEKSREKQTDRVRALGIKGRVVQAVRGSVPPMGSHLDRRLVSADRYDVPGEITLFNNKIVLLSYKGDPVGVLIESAELKKVVQSLFDLAWEKLKGEKST